MAFFFGISCHLLSCVTFSNVFCRSVPFTITPKMLASLSTNWRFGTCFQWFSSFCYLFQYLRSKDSVVQFSQRPKASAKMLFLVRVFDQKCKHLIGKLMFSVMAFLISFFHLHHKLQASRVRRHGFAALSSLCGLTNFFASRVCVAKRNLLTFNFAALPPGGL